MSPHPVGLVSLKKRRVGHKETPRVGRGVRTDERPGEDMPKGGHLQAKEKHLRETDPAGPLIFDLQPPRL